MTLEGQQLQVDRYQIIPRTVSFILFGDRVLLLRVDNNRGPWGGLYNGIGGHVEPGEDPLTAAEREIQEEAGLAIDDLTLCGVVLIDTKINPGIGLFVFVGSTEQDPAVRSPEGIPEWIPLARLQDLPRVEDVDFLIDSALHSYRTGKPFSAMYHYDDEDQLHISRR